ncbi:MAG: hypothetical protein E6905_09850, partial [Actinomyces sp.]|nr:hypothetical protein [Actinomyces sp.]
MALLPMQIAETLTSNVDAMTDDLVQWRRDFHAHPELGFLEYRTTSIIVQHLREWGYEVLQGKDACLSEERM